MLCTSQSFSFFSLLFIRMFKNSKAKLCNFQSQCQTFTLYLDFPVGQILINEYMINKMSHQKWKIVIALHIPLATLHHGVGGLRICFGGNLTKVRLARLWMWRWQSTTPVLCGCESSQTLAVDKLDDTWTWVNEAKFKNLIFTQ